MSVAAADGVTGVVCVGTTTAVVESFVNYTSGAAYEVTARICFGTTALVVGCVFAHSIATQVPRTMACACWNKQTNRPTPAPAVGETGASCYGGRLLQGHFMQNCYIDGEIADISFILIHQGNHWRNKIIDARELYEIRTNITFYTPETFLRMFTIFLLVQSIMKNGL